MPKINNNKPVTGSVADARSDAKMVKSGVGQHEKALHKGEKETKLKLMGAGAGRKKK